MTKVQNKFNFLKPGTVPLGKGCYGVSEGIVINKGRYYAYSKNQIVGSSFVEQHARWLYEIETEINQRRQQ